jgi:hypothetical protein
MDLVPQTLKVVTRKNRTYSLVGMISHIVLQMKNKP